MDKGWQALQATPLRLLRADEGRSIHQSGRAAQQQLFELLTPLLPEGHVYPDTAHSHRQFPDCVYSVSDTGHLSLNEWVIAHSVVFGVSLRHTNSADLLQCFDQVAHAIQAQEGMEVIGWATGFEPQADGGHYVIGLEVLVSRPVGYDANLDPSFATSVAMGKQQAEVSAYGNCAAQRLEQETVIIFHANTMAQLEIQRQHSFQALLGQLTYRSGEPVGAEGGLVAWVDIWYDNQRVHL